MFPVFSQIVQLTATARGTITLIQALGLCVRFGNLIRDMFKMINTLSLLYQFFTVKQQELPSEPMIVIMIVITHYTRKRFQFLRWLQPQQTRMQCCCYKLLCVLNVGCKSFSSPSHQHYLALNTDVCQMQQVQAHSFQDFGRRFLVKQEITN